MLIKFNKIIELYRNRYLLNIWFSGKLYPEEEEERPGINVVSFAEGAVLPPLFTSDPAEHHEKQSTETLLSRLAESFGHAFNIFFSCRQVF